MAYLPDFKLAANADRECGYINVTDETVYPLSTKNRNELGIALFWSKDAFATTEGVDLGNAEEWMFSADNGQSYDIKGYVVDYWDSGATYDASTLWKIVWYRDKFYIQSSATPDPAPIPNVGGTGWDQIEIGGNDPVGGGTIDDYDEILAIFEKSLNTESQDYGWNITHEATRCSLYFSEKQACHQWLISDNTGGTITHSAILLKRYDGTLLSDELTFTGGQFVIDTTRYEDGDDGVYIVEFYGRESGESEDEIKASLLIFDLCDAEACFKELFRFVICKCDNPCENEDCEEQYQISEKRYEMNSIHGLYKTIERYVFVDKFQYMGILSIDETRHSFITTVGKMIDKLKSITERCGKCSDDSSNDITC